METEQCQFWMVSNDISCGTLAGKGFPGERVADFIVALLRRGHSVQHIYVMRKTERCIYHIKSAY